MTDQPLNLYSFDGESQEELKEKAISGIDGDKLKRDLQHYSLSIVDLVQGKQKGKLDKRGFVFLVSGTWGAGKTTSTWALLNSIKAELKSKYGNEDPFIEIEGSLLPFGNASESITTFLNSFAEILWNTGIVDIRDEIKQFILEVTPASEPKYNVTASVGPLSISRPLSRTSPKLNKDKLNAKFAKLAKHNKAVVIILDDLDRLRPDEAVDVMRMVEKLRMLPRVFVVLPVYKSIVTNAFEKDLQLDPSSAATFLRKLTDAEVFVENDLSNLKKMFMDNLGKRFSTLSDRGGITFRELCWYLLLHHLVIEEAIAQASSAKLNAENINGIFAPAASTYLAEFRALLIASTDLPSSVPYPVHALDNNRAVHLALGHYYRDIRDLSAPEVLPRLRTLLKVEDVLKLVTTDQETIDIVGSGGAIPEFNLDAEEASSSPIFDLVLLPILQRTASEPFLTDNYKMRDMKILARMIQGDPECVLTGDSFTTLFNVVSNNFRRFRF